MSEPDEDAGRVFARADRTAKRSVEGMAPAQLPREGWALIGAWPADAAEPRYDSVEHWWATPNGAACGVEDFGMFMRAHGHGQRCPDCERRQGSPVARPN